MWPPPPPAPEHTPHPRTKSHGHRCPFLPAPRPPVATDPPASTHACSGHLVIDGVGQCVSFGAWLLAPSLYCDVIFNCRGESFGGQARGPRHVASSPRDLGQQLYSLRPPPRGSGLGLLICKMGRSYSRHASLAQGQRLGRGALRSPGWEPGPCFTARLCRLLAAGTRTRSVNFSRRLVFCL